MTTVAESGSSGSSESKVSTYFTPIFNTMELKKTIQLSPSELNNKNIDSILLYHLKNQVGNKCTQDGFIDKKSIVITQRTIGKMNTRYLNGTTNYQVKYSADVCNPRYGDKFPVSFVDINPSGILVEVKGTPLNIVLPKEMQTNKEFYKRLNQDESVDRTKTLVIEVLGSQVRQNVRNIFVIGNLIAILNN